jgi:hypothetical protein
MIRTPMPPRAKPLETRTPLRSASPGRAAAGGAVKSAARRKPIKPVSARRQRENRERAAMASRLWPDRRDGTVMCAVKDCPRPADDIHETLTRARSGGVITDPSIWAPVCRQHNEELTLEPDWGYEQGLLKHSGLCCEGRDVCSRYAEGGEAA